MDATTLIYIGFLLTGTAVTIKFQPAMAVAIAYLAGIIFLPVSTMTVPDTNHVSADSPYWIMPVALPSVGFLTKASVASLTALCVALFRSAKTFADFRPHWVDIPIFALCLWPMLQLASTDASPDAVQASLYLFVIWGTPWLLARLFFNDRDGQLSFIDAFVGLTLLLAPIALFESWSDARIYQWLYGPHPFADVGIDRYIGHRPLAMFEDGNQYGLWMCCAALMAIWRAKHASVDTHRTARKIVAAILLTLAVASQSVGALVLLAFGAAILLSGPALMWLRKAFVPMALLFALAMSVYLSGVIPLRTIAKETAVGHAIWSGLRASGRGSLSWRIGQDQKALPIIQENLIAGSGQWDWWQPLGGRPWGFILLMVGQFGLIGICLAFSSMLYAMWTRVQPVGQSDHRNRRFSAGDPGLVFAVMMILVMLDALLNAFVILPLLLIAGGLVLPSKGSSPDRPSTSDT
ncbi:hypothetical protein [Parasphingorhabdus sp.]